MADRIYKLTATLTDGTSVDSGSIVVPAGDKGDTGTTFTPSVSEDGTLSWTNDGGKQNPAARNIKGVKGDTGTTFTPSVDADGNISWTNDGGMPNPEGQNIKGVGIQDVAVKEGTITPDGYLPALTHEQIQQLLFVAEHFQIVDGKIRFSAEIEAPSINMVEE